MAILKCYHAKESLGGVLVKNADFWAHLQRFCILPWYGPVIFVEESESFGAPEPRMSRGAIAWFGISDQTLFWKLDIFSKHILKSTKC